MLQQKSQVYWQARKRKQKWTPSKSAILAKHCAMLSKNKSKQLTQTLLSASSSAFFLANISSSDSGTFFLTSSPLPSSFLTTL
jgi:hypothetical protein